MAKLTSRYLPSAKNLAAILHKISEGTPPPKFNVQHLKGLGFASSNDRAVIPLFKDLGLLAPDGTPTKRYHEFRARPKDVMAEALRDAYEEIFHVKETPAKGDRAAIKGKFKAALGSNDRIADLQAATFLALLELADLSAPVKTTSKNTGEHEEVREHEDEDIGEQDRRHTRRRSSDGEHEDGVIQLRYNIELHLPPTKDIEVFNAIFKSLKEHLLD